MSLRYTPILQAQPADGDVVYVRRFTRDPPVRAIWDASTKNFTMQATATLTVAAGSLAGAYTVVFTPNLHGTGLPGWFIQVGPAFLIVINATAPNWSMHITDFIASEFYGADYAPPAGPHSTTSFTQVGTPAWTNPGTMTLSALPPTPLVIPAYIVQAWRPL